jgi:hypothetical protein
LRLERWLESNYRSAVALACLLYLLIQALYVPRLPLDMDEFQGAHTVYRLGSLVPYRDFDPYKTVLGYYVQLPPLLLAPSVWTGLLWVKGWMALLNAAVLYAVSVVLAKIYRRAAVALALLMLVAMGTFLERSAALRVDMLTSLCGLASLVLLLRARFSWSGVAAALSFLVSQKGVYFLIAGGAALLCHACFARRSAQTARRVVVFGASALGVLAIYAVPWSLAGSPSSLWSATVTAHGEIALQSLYSLHHFWFQTILRNPYFYAVGVFSLGLLAARRTSDPAGDGDWHLWVYGLSMLALCLWHKQPWPYFFVLLIPTFFVLAAALFDAELARAERAGRGLAASFLAVYLVAGVAFPLTRLGATLARDSGFQRSTVEIASALLRDGDSYLAGVNLLYDRRQSVPELAWLDARRLSRLSRMDPDGLREILARLDASPPKLVVDSYRLEGLPAPLKAYLAASYEPLWGSLRIYSPSVSPAARRFHVAFSGPYLVQADPGGELGIDGRPVAPGSRIELAAGVHENASAAPFRLRFLPDLPPALMDPAHRGSRPLFPDVYGY